MKQVSAVIPNYNGRTLLKKFLPHVFKTLINKDEIIIVDDNSTDSSVKYLIKAYKLKLTKRKISTEYTKKYYPQPKKIKYKLYTNTVTVGKNKISLLLIVLEKI